MLSAGYLHDELDLSAFSTFIEHMTPENMLVFLTAKENQGKENKTVRLRSFLHSAASWAVASTLPRAVDGGVYRRDTTAISTASSTCQSRRSTHGYVACSQSPLL